MYYKGKHILFLNSCYFEDSTDYLTIKEQFRRTRFSLINKKIFVWGLLDIIQIILKEQVYEDPEKERSRNIATTFSV